MSINETIYALASAPGRAGISVVRVSGPAAGKSFTALTQKKIPEARQAKLFLLSAPPKNKKDSEKNDSRETIDRALVLYFKGPHSYTGEDVFEYHLHGGRAVVDSFMNALAQIDDHRLAEPGEFTRRAFENGRLDLTEAEAVADLINAETQAQKIAAFTQMEGSLARLYAGWTETLKKHLAHLEADIEFPDEDLPGGIVSRIKPILLSLVSEITQHLSDNRRGERLREGIKIAVVGAPNAGKSSLVNALAQRDIAIVSDIAGTTRDVIEAHLDIGGYPVILSDTAGLRPDQLSDEGHDKIESEGIRRALKLAREADIKILVFDASKRKLDEKTLALKDENSIIALNKTDFFKSEAHLDSFKKSLSLSKTERLLISVETGEGIDRLLDQILTKIKNLMGSSDIPSLTRARHRTALEEARTCLQRAQKAKLPELMAEDMRLAVRAVGRITGKVDVEDLLDVIFRDFCIGK